MKSESGFSLAIASLPLWIKMDLSLWIKIDWLFPHTGRRLGKRDRSPTPLENSCRIFNGRRAENVRTGDPWKDLTNHSDELVHFADDVWALQRLLWTSWLCRRSIRHYLWLSFHQSLFFKVHKSSPVWENGGKVTDPIRLHKQGRYLQSGVRTKGIVLLVRLAEKNAQKDLMPFWVTPRKAFKQNRSHRFGRLTSFPCSQFGCTWSGRWKTPWRIVLLVIPILILVNWWDTHMLSRMPHMQRGPRTRLGRSLGVLRRQPRGSDLHVLDTMIIRDTIWRALLATLTAGCFTGWLRRDARTLERVGRTLQKSTNRSWVFLSVARRA